MRPKMLEKTFFCTTSILHAKCKQGLHDDHRSPIFKMLTSFKPPRKKYKICKLPVRFIQLTKLDQNSHI